MLIHNCWTRQLLRNTAISQNCPATNLQCIFTGIRTLIWCLLVTTVDSCFPCCYSRPFFLNGNYRSTRIALTLAETCTQRGHCLYLPACRLPLVHSGDAMHEIRGKARCKERRHGNRGPCSARQGLYASALSRKHHSAIGPGAECSLTPVCRPRFSVACHSPSLMLTPGLSAAACRHVGIYPFLLILSLYLSLSGWDLSSSQYERNEKWLWPSSVVWHCIMHNWLF